MAISSISRGFQHGGAPVSLKSGCIELLITGLVKKHMLTGPKISRTRVVVRLFIAAAVATAMLLLPSLRDTRAADEEIADSTDFNLYMFVANDGVLCVAPNFLAAEFHALPDSEEGGQATRSAVIESAIPGAYFFRVFGDRTEGLHFDGETWRPQVWRDWTPYSIQKNEHNDDLLARCSWTDETREYYQEWTGTQAGTSVRWALTLEDSWLKGQGQPIRIGGSFGKSYCCGGVRTEWEYVTRKKQDEATLFLYRKYEDPTAFKFSLNVARPTDENEKASTGEFEFTFQDEPRPDEIFWFRHDGEMEFICMLYNKAENAKAGLYFLSTDSAATWGEFFPEEWQRRKVLYFIEPAAR